MKQSWLKKEDSLYRPVNLIRMVITLAFISWLVFVYIAVFRNGRPVSEELYQSFVYPSCTGFWWNWISEKTPE